MREEQILSKIYFFHILNALFIFLSRSCDFSGDLTARNFRSLEHAFFFPLTKLNPHVIDYHDGDKRAMRLTRGERVAVKLFASIWNAIDLCNGSYLSSKSGFLI